MEIFFAMKKEIAIVVFVRITSTSGLPGFGSGSGSADLTNYPRIRGYLRKTVGTRSAGTETRCYFSPPENGYCLTKVTMRTRLR